MHLDALNHVSLYCTSCRTFKGTVKQHKLELIPEERMGEYVITGWLECSHCKKRYRIIDGVPCLLDKFVNDGTNSQQYLDGHYGPINKLYWREMTSATGTGLCLDVGCAVGRNTFECASRGFAVGLDVNLESLRLASEFQRAGKITYNRKPRTLEDRTLVSAFTPSKNVLFILADIHNPPFSMDTFDFISALNTIDSVKRPLLALGQIDAMLKKKGKLFISSPYVWNSDVSDEWLETEDTDPHTFVKQLLTGERMPEYEFNYRIIQQKTGIPWRLRKQDTQHFLYYVDAILAEKLLC